MLSINTNLSSLIAQNSMLSSTNALNLAIERMTTGFKINHAKDNAANYSISTNMSTQLGAYDVAADNVAMGMDLVTTASDIISNMQDKASRLQALCTQARNGTYGAQSMTAINSEAAAIVSEIERLYSTAEYNGVALFTGGTATVAATPAVATFAMARSVTEGNGFISDPRTYTDEAVAAMTTMTQAVAESSLVSGGIYSISSVDELVALADYVNSGNDTTDMTFVLGANIDLSSISNWTPIGDYSTNSSYIFKGAFDGNGHVIKNLTIDNETKSYQGLFGYIKYGSDINNIGIENVNIKADSYVGGLIGTTDQSCSINNCYVTGAVSGTSNIGGIIGCNYVSGVRYCYSQATVDASSYIGGLIGYSSGGVFNSFATGNVTGCSNVGGLIGSSISTISGCYASGTVIATDFYAGGLVGFYASTYLSGCYATGDVFGTFNTGGLIGYFSQRSIRIDNLYATGNVNGDSYVGGLIGYVTNSSNSKIENSFATGDVTGQGSSIGGFIGSANISTGDFQINSSYATGIVNGSSSVGGFAGSYYKSSSNIASVQSDSNATQMTEEEILAVYTPDTMGFTETNGWVIVDGTPIHSWQTTSYSTTPDPSPAPSPDPDPGAGGGTGGGAGGSITGVESFILQIGINADSSCQIGFDTNFEYDLSVVGADIASDNALAQITDFIYLLSEKSTQLGAVQNRLESAFESISVSIENLTSSRSTIRDADIAEVSSEYIRQQILQQASVTLMATANQSPSIALQLI